MIKRFIVAVCFVIGLLTVVHADNKTSEFIRLRNTGAEPGLQIAVTDYVSSTSSATVTLYGVVHIADKTYYDKVQKDLDGFDSVLYEGVGGDKAKMTEQKAKPSVLSCIQHLAGDVLGLNFQLESIDYTRKNLVHADVQSMEELKEKLNGESIVPMGQYVKEDQLEFLKPLMDVVGPAIRAIFKAQPDLQNELKGKLATQLSETDVNTQLSPEMHKAIVIDRNKIVIDVLEKELTKENKKTIAVFYGAAHMPDLEERLAKLGFKKQSKRWMTAWNIKPEDVTGDEEGK